MSRKKVSFTRTIDVGPCRLTVDCVGNPLTWSAEDRAKVEKVLNAVDVLHMLENQGFPNAGATSTGVLP